VSRLDNLPALIRSCIDHEDEHDWSPVRRVPSTHTWKTVDYIRALDRERRSELLRAFASNALFYFPTDRDPPLHAAKAGHPEYAALLQAEALMAGAQYADVRSLRAILADQEGKRPTPAFANTPPEVIARAQGIRPTNARQIRKVVRHFFGERFGARPDNAEGGDWLYRGIHRGRGFVVAIDYGGWDQLRYEVEFEDSRTSLRVRRLNYERLVGAGLGSWDSLTAENLEESIVLLCGLVETLVELPDRLEGEGAA
jgi:hypothetical protein